MFTIRKASEGENVTLIEIWERSVRATHDFITEEQIKKYKSIILKNALSKGEVLCSVYNDEIIGFGTVNDKNLGMLFLDPKYFRRGFGEKILNYIIKNYKIKTLEVYEENKRAYNLYIKSGFEVVKRTEKDERGNNIPLLYMEYKEKV